MNLILPKLKFLLLELIVSATFSLYAQVTTTPYFCGFEDITENGQWNLNVGPNGQNAANRWYIGTGEKNTGANGLYISSDNGTSGSYVNNQVSNVCYRSVTLPAGTYDLSFIWRALGESNNDGFYVCWMPATITTNSSALGLPNWVNTYALSFNNVQLLNGSSTWTNQLTQITSNGGAYKLVFVWNNNAGTNNHPAACIDNIQMAPISCIKPINFTCTSPDGTSAILSWSGTVSSYDIMYRAYGDTIEHFVTGIVGNVVTVNNLSEGLYDFWIRSNCDSTHSSIWVSFNNVLLYSPAAHCIDYLNLNNAICMTGTFDNPDEIIEKVDDGPDSKTSRHTVHFTPNETDPRTLNHLKTVPNGEIASVRLGNWDNGSEEESIVYSYTVPATGMPIILLKYAIVLEEPGHAGPPRFQIEITNAAGQVIDPVCGAANLSTEDAAAEGWSTVPAVSGGFGEIWYKDWTTMGMNMAPYAGQTIKIKLSTYDCSLGGHFGYAYFTLNCTEAEISGLSCGNVQTTSISAPDGFIYQWYNALDPSVIVSTDQDLSVNMNDTSTYLCDVIFMEKPSCRFTLSASLAPRAPLSRFSPLWVPSNCRNYVNFRNTSVVATDKGPTSEKCETFYWDFGDGRTSTLENPIIEFPQEGGTYHVVLATGISNNMCLDTSYVDLVVPAIGTSTDTIIKKMCQGSSFTMNGVRYTQTGFYAINLKSQAGCDSIINLDIEFLNKIEAEIHDTICADETYAFNGQTFNKSGTYYGTVASSMGCDSITTLYLTKLDPIIFTAKPIDPYDGPSSGSLELTGFDGSWTYYLNGVESASLDSLPVGNYVFEVFNEYGCSAVYNFTLTISCLDVDFLPMAEICGDDQSFTVPYIIKDGRADSYSIKFNSDAIAHGFQNVIDASLEPDYIEVSLPNLPRPNNYTMDIVFKDINCGELNKTLSFSVLYPSSVLAQKWNDVLALLNSSYNGGYQFTSYQWYKNGLPLSDETNSYLYLTNRIFDLNDEYRVLLTRADDGVAIFSCAVYPELRNDITVRPTLVTPRSFIRVYGLNQSGTATFWDLTGRIVSQESFEYLTGTFTAPAEIGVFVLEILTQNDRKVFKIVVEQ